VILGATTGLPDDVAAALAGHAIVRLVPGAGGHETGAEVMEIDFASRESLAACHRRITDTAGRRVGAIVNLLGLCPPFTGPGATPLPLSLAWLHVIQAFGDDLRASARDGGGWIVNVTSLDGRFGGAFGRPDAVVQAGTLGISKAVARELAGVRVRNVDVAPDLPADRQAALVAAEFLCADDLLEVGHDRSGRWMLQAVPARVADADLGPLPVDGESVILITGGAGGVTAAVALELARQARPLLVLVGRSPLPAPEDEATRCLDRDGLRAHVLERATRGGHAAKPAEIEARVKRILKDREILANIAAMRAAGARVEYHAIDVRDGDAFPALVQRIYVEHGRLDGVVHGAGVVEDKFLRDKTAESFARVFSTKVDPALALVRGLRFESLAFLVFFSSVSARLGARGQVDYGAANEVLNKLAAHVAGRSATRVVAINWGPWRGGMVSDGLLRQYAARNIAAIDVAAGARQFVRELRLARASTPEVLIVAGSFSALARAAGESGASPA
jgi:NAD(P)-dependent dehydrogenase (short-subunit alcohol dehydrogenase family)